MIPRQQSEILAMLQAGPVHIAELAARRGKSKEACAQALRCLRNAGLVGPTRKGGSGVMWALEALATKMRAEHAATPKPKRKRLSQNAARLDRRMADIAESEAEADRWAESAPVRRWVSAADAPPLVVRAANSSIFALAGVV